jgi:DNA-binding CsgD family transcriptional regulator
LESLEALAVHAAQQRRETLSVRLFGAADALRSGHGLGRPAGIGSGLSPHLSLLRAVLGHHKFDLGWAAGAQMTVPEAVSYAMTGTGKVTRQSDGWDRLTAAELEVVALVKDGLTNAEIGERLFLSKHTISTHLTHIYRKLGVKSRREVAHKARQRSGDASPLD